MASFPDGERQGPGFRRNSIWWVLAAAVLVVALVGYIGYVVYPRFDLPASTGWSLIAIAVAAGVASFFSPCSFPLLTTLLAADVRPDEARAEQRAVVLAASMSLGALAFLLILGAGIALGGAALFSRVTFTSDAGRLLRLAVALVLILFGLLQLRVLPGSAARLATFARPAYEWLFARREAGHPAQGYAAYGFGYLVAGFG